MRLMQEAMDKSLAWNISLNDRVSDIEKDKVSNAAIATRNRQAAPANSSALGKNHYDNYK